jgi:hypothetical protein
VFAAGLLDVLELHIVPVVLGDGMRLFDPAGLALGDREGVELRPTRVVHSSEVTHVRYEVVGPRPLDGDERPGRVAGPGNRRLPASGGEAGQA